MGIQNTNGSCFLERGFNVYTKYKWAMLVGKELNVYTKYEWAMLV